MRVGSDNQPGSLRYLRVNERFFQTDEPNFRGAEAAAIVELLKTPGEFAFEWAQRPDEADYIHHVTDDLSAWLEAQAIAEPRTRTGINA